MQDQARPKELQRTLGEGTLLQTYAQRHLPAQLELGPRLGLLVGYSLMGLQEQRRRQQARGDARTPVVRAIEIGEVLLAQEFSAVGGEESVEGVSPHVIQVGVLALVMAGSFPKHRKHLPVVSQECTQARLTELFGHTSRACYEPTPRIAVACWRKRQAKATKCSPARVVDSLS
jgi:hypothetical protein